jgi:hypothetical protein
VNQVLGGLIGKVLDILYTILDLLVLEAGKAPGWEVSNKIVLCIITALISFALVLAYKKIRRIRMRFVPFA